MHSYAPDTWNVHCAVTKVERCTIENRLQVLVVLTGFGFRSIDAAYQCPELLSNFNGEKLWTVIETLMLSLQHRRQRRRWLTQQQWKRTHYGKANGIWSLFQVKCVCVCESECVCTFCLSFIPSHVFFISFSIFFTLHTFHELFDQIFHDCVWWWPSLDCKNKHLYWTLIVNDISGAEQTAFTIYGVYSMDNCFLEDQIDFQKPNKHKQIHKWTERKINSNGNHESYPLTRQRGEFISSTERMCSLLSECGI